MKKIIFTLFFILPCLAMNTYAQEKAEAQKQEVKTTPTDSTEPKIFRSVEQMPEFPGGEAAMMKYLGEQTIYPRSCVENDVQGKIIMNFVINENGGIEKILVKRSPCTSYANIDTTALTDDQKKLLKAQQEACPDLEKEAIRVLESMPLWSPGRLQGKPVKVYFNFPFVFKLK